MFFNSKQLRIFKGVKERVWHQQNNLRKPFEKQWRNALKNFFNGLASGVKEAYRMRSQIMLDFEMRKQAETLKLIFRVQYTIIGNAFKDYALGRLFLSKAFDEDFDKALAEFIDENSAVWVTEIDETRRKLASIDHVLNDVSNIVDGFIKYKTSPSPEENVSESPPVFQYPEAPNSTTLEDLKSQISDFKKAATTS